MKAKKGSIAYMAKTIHGGVSKRRSKKARPKVRSVTGALSSGSVSEADLYRIELKRRLHGF